MQGFSITCSMIFVGALTSTNYLDLYKAVLLLIIGIIAHSIPTTLLEVSDYELDKQIPESKLKPIVSGTISKREGYTYIIIGTSILFAIILFLFYEKPLAIVSGIIAYSTIMWYCSGYGKRFLFSYDFTFSISYCSLVLFGAFAIGNPTIYTWIFIGIVATGGTAFAQWENSLKDVDFDRSVGIRSFAVVLGLTSKTKLSWKNAFVLYGVGIKAVLLFFCFYSFYIMWKFPDINANYFGFLAPPYKNYSFAYLIFILTFGIGSQLFILWRFVNKRERLEHRKTILYDVFLTAIIGFSVIIGYVGFIIYAIMILFIIFGYLIGSALQYGAEFKFGRYKEIQNSSKIV